MFSYISKNINTFGIFDALVVLVKKNNNVNAN